ncbi:MAG: hypothetical protein QOE28_406 [Solirubrobacteraceae bacterium]|nr:hypothetical protein [Solirubrobacteraceae bacterium]
MKVLSVNFNPFGNRSQASARLRAWSIADELRLRGHRATVADPSRTPAVEVFQKVRDFNRLGHVRRRGVLTVYDLDDNYLLEDSGTRKDILAFINLVDLVTVGSEAIFSEVSRYHDTVGLFENPLDIQRGSPARNRSIPWRGEIGWFGNRTNLRALEAIGLRYGVTTVTQGGDIEWALGTVDEAVASFDLVVIPVQLSEWTASKNANRLLKSIALGVPPLASRTPEHEQMVERLGLPDWLLVSAGEDWDEAIDAVRTRYAEAIDAVREARKLAFERYGIGPTTSAWTDRVTALLEARSAHARMPGTRARPPAAPGLERLRDTDVVIFNENEPDFAARTIASLDREGAEFRSLTLVSANPCPPPDTDLPVEVADAHDDFFAIYETLASQLLAGDGEQVLLLRAGTELRRGFFAELAAEDPRPGVQLFQEQLSGDSCGLVPRPPATVDELMLRPHHPHALLVGRDELESVGGLSPGMASFGLWDLLLGLFQQPDVTVAHCAVPMILVEPRAHRRHTIQCYSVWIARNRPELAEEMPSHKSEWQRLSYILHAAIVERHAQLFATRAPSVVPALRDEVVQLELEVERLDERLRAERRAVSVLERAARADKKKRKDEPAPAPAPVAITVEPDLEAAPVPRSLPVGIRAPARVVRAVVRPAIPDRMRARLYRRFRTTYDRLFPERENGQGPRPLELDRPS